MSVTPATRCAAYLSTKSDAAEAAREACQRIKEKLTGKVDLAIVFVTHFHAPNLQTIADILTEELHSTHLLGCTGESIVCNSQELEEGPGISLWAAELPQTTLESMKLEFAQTPDGGTFTGWPDGFEDAWPEDSALIALADPFSFPADAMLERLNEEHPGVPVLGGMASGGFSPMSNGLFFGNQVLSTGAVALRLSGGVKVQSVVSQGCLPIGKPFVITSAERNLIHSLGGKPPLQQLGEMFPELTEREQQLVRKGLHVGRVVSEYQDKFERGDFLIRNVMGVDEDSGAMAVGDYFRTGQTIQFHVRDETSADEDLEELLKKAAETMPAPVGGLLFTCNGRGTRLFSEPHHDATAIAQQFPDLPVAGFFAQGEIGPVGQQNFLHGFTASLALFGE